MVIIAEKYEGIVYNKTKQMKIDEQEYEKMQKMTLKKYATTHKMSLFNVVKMVKSGELRSETVEENGKEVTYVLVDTPAPSVEEKPNTSGRADEEELAERVAVLEKEVATLRRELDALKISMGLKG
jgi:hypothetical protein